MHNRDNIGAALLAFAILAAAGTARAEAEAAVEPSPPAEAEPWFDPDRAWKQSLGYTLALVGAGGIVIAIEPPVGAVVVGIGVGIGPSMGHFYIERWEHALVFAALRLGLGVAAGACLVSALGRDDGPARSLLISGAAVAGAGALALAIYDIAVVARHAREANAELGAVETAFAPTIHRGGGGLALVGRF